MPRHAARSEHRVIARRTVLGGGAVLLVAAAGGGGVAAGVWRPVRQPRPVRPPADLVAALAAEDDLLRAVAATAAHDAATRGLLHAIRADHVAHRRAIAAAIGIATRGWSSGPSPAAPAGTSAAPDTIAHLRAAEQRAATAAAARAARLHGADAAALASIAACEAVHAELLR